MAVRKVKIVRKKSLDELRKEAEAKAPSAEAAPEIESEVPDWRKSSTGQQEESAAPSAAPKPRLGFGQTRSAASEAGTQPEREQTTERSSGNFARRGKASAGPSKFAGKPGARGGRGQRNDRGGQKQGRKPRKNPNWEKAPGETLYVGNFPFDTSKDTLVELLSPFGDVHKPRVITDARSRRAKGYGFAALDGDVEGAIAALHGSEFGGRTLVVKIADNRAKEK